ncbi:hypothetical protein [Buttiauxella agrestis]|uniref:Uncharacterized protein n=1 Tax=Buttiauxella agrestis ATCC 33320 TaxID=1006004 RepID=A0A085GM79_9ENTR|nr:hypothetical protein [Buttiauxella agrestis]KFC84824.1 hypothetical protein GBAG_0116 [Buttiauxella agrestis ATCC 33320]
MLKIVNSVIELEITPFEKITNTPEFGFYHKLLNMYVEFKSKGIHLATTWECYLGELEEFQHNLCHLRENNSTDEVTFSPMEGMITLIVGKNIIPFETYYLKFKLSTEAHADIFIEGSTGLDQTYIQEIIQGVHELIVY